MSNEWRRVAAALADDGRRATYAEVVLGQPGQQSARRTKHLRALIDAGLLDSDLRPTDVFAQLLSENPPVRREGIDRWIANGRIERWPVKASDRIELLQWVAARALGTDDVLDEAQLGERLEAFHGDTALLRRYLVDHGLVERDADGSRYRLPASS